MDTDRFNLSKGDVTLKKKHQVGFDNVVNLTPHDINVIMDDGTTVILPKSSNTSARCSEYVLHTFTDILPVNVVSKKFGDTENLPNYKEGTYYVVSAIVKSANPYRMDLLLVNDTVRNDAGQIVGCKTFAL
jgi:hypothetical protein